MYQTIKYEVKENIGYVTINRPEALNALNTEEIELSFVGEVKPITIKNTKEDGLIQLVVPIRTY